ncbi:MAG: fused MFS/spermidine synthase [Rhodobacteraceae bacterium]|nr:fused MFS/spermidine synthase [Paracoccaceae bacterium]
MRSPLWLLLLVQGVVSAASLVVEIVAGRMLAPYVGMSLYTWTSIIAVVLAGFSVGHWWGGLLAERDARRAMRATGWAMLAAALTTAVALILLQRIAGPVLLSVGHPVWGIVVLSMLVFFLPSLFAGIPAPVLARIAVDASDRSGRALGAIFAVGAVGAIVGTLLAGFLFISWLGTTATLAVVTLAYLGSALACFAMAGGRIWVPLLAGLVALGLAGYSLAAPNPCTRESRYFCIRTLDMSDDPSQPVRLMVIDHLGHGISAKGRPKVMFTEHAAMLDALARLRANRADFTSFFIGGGSYSIPRSWQVRNTGPRTVAEIDPEVTVVAVSDFWFDANSARILHQDARRALLTRADKYDVIIGDAFADVAVPAHLITKEFYQLVASRLAPNGTYLMNVIDYEDRLEAVASVALTLQQVFPVVEIWTNTTRPAAGARVVFVLVAGQTPTAQGRITASAPDPTEFGAMAPDWVTDLATSRGIILSDNFAPIDRLIGRPD